jgi:hypothetical protein
MCRFNHESITLEYWRRADSCFELPNFPIGDKSIQTRYRFRFANALSG